MIHIVVGSYETTKKTLLEITQKFQERGVSIYTFYSDDCSEKDFEFLVPLGKNLFGESEVFIFKNCLSEIDISTVISAYKDSENEIFFIEEKFLKKERTLFEKNNIEIIDCSTEPLPKKNNFNLFKIADSFGKRDKKQLWLDYQEALAFASPEEIHGILFWQIKNIALIKWDNGRGMKPFVLKKNKIYAQNFSDKEIKKLSTDFIKIFHDRKNISTLTLELEKIILSL